MSSQNKPPVTLTIAGTDPSGGAGIQADLKTFTALGCYGTSAITALVAQNTLGVEDVHPVPAAFVKKQIKSILDDMEVAAMKTGMLFNEEVTRIVCETLRSHYPGKNVPPLVVDPVCVSTSGHTLLEAEALGAVIKDLFPLAHVVTPNKQEAELILSWGAGEKRAISSLEDMLPATEDLAALGPKAVLLKGGHFVVEVNDLEQFSAKHSDIEVYGSARPRAYSEVIEYNKALLLGTKNSLQLVVDVLYEKELRRWSLFVRPRIDSTSTHGTGCTLSAALTCELAKDRNDLVQSVLAATEFTHLGIETAPGFGRGHGPLNHLHAILPRQVPISTPSCPFPFTQSLMEFSRPVWDAFVGHQFVTDLGKGLLDEKCFKHFIKQDYIYLKYYARAYGLLAAKLTEYSTIDAAGQIILSITRESKMHVAYCETWGISETELRSTAESSATAAYGGYLLNIGIQGDVLKLMVAFMACLLGYGEVGLFLLARSKEPNSGYVFEGNPYRRWIEDYSGRGYQEAVRRGILQLEALILQDPPSKNRLRELQLIWHTCTKLEKDFWDMAMSLT